MQNTHQPILTTTVVATADLLTPRRFIGFDGAYCKDGAKALGALEATVPVGRHAPVNAIGIVLVEAGGAIAQGAQVQSDNLGRAVALTSGKSNGYALDAASAEGEIIRVLRGGE